MEYNTGRDQLHLMEFGRNIQKLANYIAKVEDKKQRSHYAEGMIELMKQVVPTIKDGSDNNQALWDDLHLLTDFNIDIDSPYPVPEADLLDKKPQKVEYCYKTIKFRHYGYNIELMVREAIKIDDPENRKLAIIHIGKLMKSYHQTWSKETIDDIVILKNIEILSEGALKIDPEIVKKDNLFEPLYKEKVRHNTSNNKSKKSFGHKSQKRRRY